MAKYKLTGKQESFVREYLIDLNGTQAAIRAGYSKKGAERTAAKLLRSGKVSELIIKEKAARAKRTLIDADWVLTELARVYKTSVADFLHIPEPDEEGNRRAPSIELSGVEFEKLAILEECHIDTTGGGDSPVVTKTKIKLPTKLKTLELIGKHVGVQAFKDQIGHSGELSVALKDLYDKVKGNVHRPKKNDR